MQKKLKNTLNDYPFLVYSDNEGNIYEDRNLLMVAREGRKIRLVELEELIELPEGSNLFFIPDSHPIGYDPFKKSLVICKKGLGVATFLPPAYTITGISAFYKKKNYNLPLFAYAAIGWYNNKFYVPAFRVDKDIRQECRLFNQKKVLENIKVLKKKFPKNRVFDQLIICATEYYCPAARNFFLNRYEAPLPTSPFCNSKCIGCISNQPKESGFPPTQYRIKMIPTPEEIAEIAIFHLNTAKKPIVSFGQGCEGEPLMVYDTIAEAIRIIRNKTKKGAININTNGSLPDKLEKIIKAGLDSARISINSFIKENYVSYFKPINYNFEDVLQSISLLRKYKVWTSINYFNFPGLTNSKEEINALYEYIEKLKFNMIQWRNLNIDPDLYVGNIQLELINQPNLNVKKLIEKLKENFPWLIHGYFNPYIETIKSYNF